MPRWWIAAPLVACALLAQNARGEDAPPSPPAPPENLLVVSRADACRIGAARGPGVEVAAAPRFAARDAESAASPLPRPPVVSLVGGYRAGALGPGPELGVTVTQDLSLHGLGGARARSAAALTRFIDMDTARSRLDAAARAAVAWAGVLEAKELLRLRQDALTQAAGVTRIAESRVRSGVGQPYELALARGDEGNARASVYDAEGMLVEALTELRFSLGLEPTALVDASGDLYATDDRPLDEAAAVRLAEQSHPALAAARARAKLAEEDVRVTAAALGPALTIGGAYLREGTGDQVWTGLVGIPLPVVRPQAYEIARQRALAETAEAQSQRVHAETMRDVHLALHDREHWREVRDELRKSAIAPSTEALRLARATYEAGTQDVTALLLARQRLATVQEQLARVAAEVQRADVRLARAIGDLTRSGATS